jgi:predicted transcriptional regulator of viral defense system
MNMNDELRKKILYIFEQNHGYSSTGEVREQGIHNTYLIELEKEGIIKKAKRGLYVLAGKEPESGLIEAMRLVPGGVVCLTSALSFFHLTTIEPLSIYIAIEHKRKIVLPEYPPIRLIYFTDKRFKTGIFIHKIDSQEIRLYNKEKTLCDAVFYRHKIGIDIVKEALQNYTREQGKNIKKLLDLAKTLRVEKVIRQYLEVLV